MDSTVTKYKASQVVKEALRNAEIVLDYIAENGIEFNKDDIFIITIAKKTLIEDNWGTEIENNFWSSYKNLTAVIKPVDLESLLAMRELYIKNPSFLHRWFNKEYRSNLAYRTVRFYTAFALVTMLVMLILHIYFSVGTVRLNKIQTINNQIEQTQNTLTELNNITESTNLSAQQKKENIFSQLAEYNTEKQSNIKLLAKWVYSAKNIFSFEQKQNVKADKDYEQRVFSDINSFSDSPEQELKFNIETIQQAQNYVFIIGLYILPLFYGLLGAITYVLRDMSNKIQRKQYKKDNNIAHVLRLILGIIAGLAVGVFWGDLKQQENLTVISSLGPLIVAFIAGLTVESLFSGIEKWVSSFVQKGTVAGATAEEKKQ